MQKLFMVPARCLVAGFGLAAAGAALSATVPEFLTPVAAIAALLALVVMVRPLPLGWLRYRAVGLGLAFGALVLVGLNADPNDREQVKVGGKAETAVERAPKAKTAPPNLEAETAKAQSSPLNDRTKQIAWIEISKDAVRNRLKDPRSAQFRNVVFHAYQGTTPVVCGEVNATNSYGGYSGYQGFIASGETLVFIESDFQAGEFAKSWNEMCRG